MWYEGGAEFYAALDAGDIVIGNFWHGSATKKALEEPEKYAVYFPEEGAVAYLDYWTVVRGTQKRDLAEYFINYTLSEEAQSRFAAVHYQIMANSKTEIPEAVANIYPDTLEKWQQIELVDVVHLEPLRAELEERFKKEVLIK